MNPIIGLIKKESPFHRHKDYEIIVYVKGNGCFKSMEKEFAVSPGKIVIVPPGVMHSATFSETFERIYIQGEFRHIFNFTSPIVVLDNSEKEGIYLAKMIYNNRYDSSGYTTALLDAFAHFLMQGIKMQNRIGSAIEDMINVINSNFYDCNINLNILLENSGYAADYIRAQFKKITGITPTEFLTKVRIKHACYLINTYENSLSLAEISEKCGYTDYMYFSKKFKSIMGVSPKKYKSDSFDY